jgi:hypothetical protein
LKPKVTERGLSGGDDSGFRGPVRTSDRHCKPQVPFKAGIQKHKEAKMVIYNVEYSGKYNQWFERVFQSLEQAQQFVAQQFKFGNLAELSVVEI